MVPLESPGTPVFAEGEDNMEEYVGKDWFHSTRVQGNFFCWFYFEFMCSVYYSEGATVEECKVQHFFPKCT